MENLLKNKKQILVVRICLMLGSLIPIVWYILNRLPDFNNYQYYYWIPFTLIYTILFILALFTHKKLIFNLSFILLNIVNIPGCFGFHDINTFIILLPQESVFYFNDIKTVTLTTLITILLIISIYIVIRHSKTAYSDIRLKHLIPYVTASIAYAVSLFLFGYGTSDPLYLIQALMPYLLFCICFLFCPKKSKNNYSQTGTPEIQLSNLNNLYISGKITTEQYNTERQKIIENI